MSTADPVQVLKMSAVQTRACTLCGAPLRFVPIVNGKKPHPFNADGSSHFSTCPKADQYRKQKAPASTQPPLFAGTEPEYPD